MSLDLPATYNATTTFVDENIERGRGKRVAIYYQDQTFTYEDVYEKVNQTGNALKELGADIEQRVLLALPDAPEFVFSFFGAVKIGAVPIPTNPWMKAKDYEYLLNDSRARVAVIHESVLPEFEPIWNNPRYLKAVLVVGKPKGRAVSFEVFTSKASSRL
jgi:benzoate-CoA ligase